MWYVKPGAEPTFDVDAVRERAKEYDKRNNFWGRNPGNVWEVDRVAFGATEQTSHIAVFPEEVSERIVRACSKPGDLVLDPFAGSGTTPKVARGLGRRWIGIEISPVYAMEAAVRIGYQQPSEADSLASELIKHVGFGGVQRSMPCSDLLVRLQAWANHLSVSEMRTTLGQDIASVFADGNGRNGTKQRIWRKYDDILSLSEQSPLGAVCFADKLLTRCYKLRQHFNGVSRCHSALNALETVRDQILGNSPLEYLRTIALKEPSSFTVTDDHFTLRSIGRSVASESTESHQPIRANDVDPQWRML